jgi:hypothetical protein
VLGALYAQVNANFDVKVCDFGLSCVKEIPKPGDKLRDTAVGSPIWMAPEGAWAISSLIFGTLLGGK